jgi:hypothetical protein
MRFYFIAFVCLFHLLHAGAQSNPFFKKEDKILLSAVVNNAIYVLQQDYYIMDTTAKEPKKLGLNNKRYFGRFYFIALLAEGKFYTDGTINAPWKLDSAFANLKVEGKYKPFLGNLSYRRLDENVFRNVDSIDTYNKLRDSSYVANSRYAILTAPDSLPGLRLASFTEPLADSTAWFWSVKDPQARFYDGNVLQDTISKYDFDASKGKYDAQKQSYINSGYFYSNKTMIGFILTTKASLGKVEFFLHGLVIRNQKGKYDPMPLNTKTILLSAPKIQKEKPSEIPQASDTQTKPNAVKEEE